MMLFWDPIPSQYEVGIDAQKPVLVLGVDGSSAKVLCVDGDGFFHLLPLAEVQSDYRYYPDTRQWGDAQGVATEET